MTDAGGFEVTIRDGRAGRDPALVDENGNGQILGLFRTDEWPKIGERLTLDDGSPVEIIGIHERYRENEGLSFAVHVGNVP